MSSTIRTSCVLLSAALLLAVPSPAIVLAQAVGGALDHLEGTPDELAGWDALEASRWIAAREVGEKLLKRDPNSFTGHFILGMALHRGEGDLARAVFHLELAMHEYERRWPPSLGDAALPGLAPSREPGPWRWHQATLRELQTALGAMDKPGEQIVIIEKHNKLYSPAWQAHRIWPLMKLRRYDESRAAAKAAMASDVPGAAKYARADLCGAESESGDRQRSWDACFAATSDYHDTASMGGQLEFSNASDSALEVFRFDDAERLILEATRRPNTVLWVNPFRQAAELFVSEGRIAEAIDAMRGGQELRIARPAWVDQFDRASFDATLAKLFLLVGLTDRAVGAAERAIGQPDRQGHASGSETQAESAARIVLAVGLGEQAERASEDAVTSGFVQSVRLRLRAAWERLQAWRAARAAAVALADEEFLVRSLRPYYLGISLPPWLLPEVVDTIGGGVALAGLERARAVDRYAGVARYFHALEAEAQRSRGDLRAAEGATTLALASLPQAEVLLRARMDLIAGECARARGDRGAMGLHFLRALQHDPGLFRRMRVALPVSIETDGSHLGALAARLVARSPRFEEGEGPLRVVIRGGHVARACLEGGAHEQLACASVNLPDDVSDKVGSRLLIEEFHKCAFAVKADLTQADLTSLDGSPTAGRADHQVQSVLDLLGDAPR